MAEVWAWHAHSALGGRLISNSMWVNVVPAVQAILPAAPQQASVGSTTVSPSPLRSACGAAGSLWSACGKSNNTLHQCGKATAQHGGSS